MAQQVVLTTDPVSAYRTKFNANFTELYTVYIVGEETTFSDLTSNQPPASHSGEYWIVLTATGSKWFLNYKESGLYRSNGSAWVKMGVTLASERADNVFRIHDQTNSTKTFGFTADAIGTGTNRLLAVPNADGTLTLLAATQTLTNKTLDVANNTILNAGLLEMLKIGTPQYSNMKSIQSTTHSAGYVAGAAFSDNHDGSLTVGSGDGLIRATDDVLADLYACEWAEDTNVSLTDNSINYIYAQFTSTSTDPTITSNPTRPSDTNTNIILGSAYRSGTEIHVTTVSKHTITNHIGNIIQRFEDTRFFEHASGAALTEVGTRQLKVTAGLFWEALNSFTTIEQDTSGASPVNNHTFEYFYYNGSTWITHEEAIAAVTFTGSGLDDATSGGTFVGSHTIRVHVEIDANGTPDTFKWSYIGSDGVTVIETTGVAITGSAQTLVDGATITFAATTGHTIGDEWDFDCTLSNQIDNTQYNDIASGLSTLSNNQYSTPWVYLDIHGHVAVLFGQASLTLAQAEDAQPPSILPPEFEGHVRLIGKIIIGKSDAAFTSIENNYGSQFQGSVPGSHADLSGLTADDHIQYLRTDGTRELTGPWNMGIFTPTADNQEFIRETVNAGGFADVHSKLTTFNLGAMAAGETTAVQIINTNITGSTGGTLSAYGVTKGGVGSAEVYGYSASAGVNPFIQLAGTFGDMDSALVNATDRLTEFTSIGSDIQMWVADNDTVTVGNATKFQVIDWDLAIVADGDGIDALYEHSTGVGTWAFFNPSDTTSGMRNNGQTTWLDADIPSWSVGVGSEYLIRITRTANTLATPPTENVVQIAATTIYTWDKSGNLSINGLTIDGVSIPNTIPLGKIEFDIKHGTIVPATTLQDVLSAGWGGSITGWKVSGDNVESGSITWDISKNGTSITGAGTKPFISSGTDNSGTDMTNWTTAFAADDEFKATTSGVTTFTASHLTIYYIKT